MGQLELTKTEIMEQAQQLGAEFVGFAPVDRWIANQDAPLLVHPRKIWPQAKTVIVLGVPLWLPLLEAAPTVLGREQAIVTNELLTEVAFRLAVFLKRSGHESINISQGNSVFSHIWAGYYAGLGTVGWNNSLLTPEYGPRVHLVSVFTALELDGDPMVQAELCTKCLYCQKICPVQALSGDNSNRQAKIDQTACLSHEKRLQKAFCDPCGSCIKVCPVGEDRQLFQSNNFVKYFEEQEVLAHNPAAEEYKDWVHIRSYGSFALEPALLTLPKQGKC